MGGGENGVVDLGVGQEEQYNYSKGRAFRSTMKITAVLWLGFPFVVLLIAVPCGAVFAAIEDWDFKDGLYYIAAVISTSVSNLAGRVPSSDGGRLAAVIFASWGLGFFALGSAVLATPIAAPIISLAGLSRSSYEDIVPATTHPVLKLCAIVFIGLPVSMLFLCSISAAIIAGVEEGWGYQDGFRYSISITSGFAELSSDRIGGDMTPFPTTAFGKILGLLISSWGLGLYAFTVAAVGSQFFPPLLKAIEVEMHDN